MKYDPNDAQSTNVEDRRDQSGEGLGGGGGGMQLPIGGGMGLTTMLIVGAVMLLFGFNPLELLGGGGAGGMPNLPQHPRVGGATGQSGGGYGVPGANSPAQPASHAEDPMKVRVAQVLKDTEDVWTDVFQSMGKRYTPPRLVIFSGATRTGCGTGQTAMGPFYCPVDRQVYIDLAFYDELKRRFHAPGDFAQAYVVAHEVGHHVQTLLGITDQVEQQKSRARSQKDVNAIGVRMELQADCFAGVWAARDYQLHKERIQPGDIESGLNAASQIGDDTLQRQTQGYVVPDAFTHGSSKQRVAWFKQGMQSGQIQQCDTFGMQDPQ